MAASRPVGGLFAAPNVQGLNGNPFGFAQHHLTYSTDPGPSFHDITADVQRIVDDSGLHFGQVTIFSNHTTAAIRLQENEPLLIEDLKDLLRRLAPQEGYYRHNDFDIRTVNMHPDEPKNGHSHCQHVLLSTSETVPLVNGSLQLGQYQDIFLVELDSARERRVTVNIIGCRGD
jgi:secondary thiamine-phosphate synthase enzyme